MRKLIVVCLLLNLTANADAQSWKSWWKHHHVLCMCIGNPIGPIGGN
jgi:hypothetical protein